ncbi:MAG: formyl transferase [Kangiellaceae bacterium]|nr:formyl transferase [Kangiellaceae bacterium]
MKILILCNNDLPSLFAMNLLLPRMAGHTVLMGQSSKVGGDHQRPHRLTELAQFELDILSGKNFQFLNQFKPENTDSLTWCTSFEELVVKNKIERRLMNDINLPEGIQFVRHYMPDLVLSIRFGKILQQPIIDIPRFGVINLHSGNLPDYQGVMASFWAMLNSDPQIGTCLHYISDKEIDSGAIIKQSYLRIDHSKSYLENVLQLYFEGTKMMSDVVDRLSEDGHIDSTQQSGESTYYGFPQQADVIEFEKKGFRLF